MSVRLLTEQHLELLSLKGGCTVGQWVREGTLLLSNLKGTVGNPLMISNETLSNRVFSNALPQNVACFQGSATNIMNIGSASAYKD